MRLKLIVPVTSLADQVGSDQPHHSHRRPPVTAKGILTLSLLA
jgi:hypothetical protein